MKVLGVSKTYYKCIFIIVVSLMILHFAVSKAEAQYVYGPYPTYCGCGFTLVGILSVADWSQDPDDQDDAWDDFRDTYGLSDSDRLGNATRVYNCHNYAFLGWWGAGQSYWLQSWAVPPFFGGETNCWYYDMSYGFIYSSPYHSCYVTNTEGKCGDAFLCTHNQYVYGASMPTDRYNIHF